MRQWEKFISNIHLAIEGIEVSVWRFSNAMTRDQYITWVEIHARWYELVKILWRSFGF